MNARLCEVTMGTCYQNSARWRDRQRNPMNTKLMLGLMKPSTEMAGIRPAIQIYFCVPARASGGQL